MGFSPHKILKPAYLLPTHLFSHFSSFNQIFLLLETQQCITIYSQWIKYHKKKFILFAPKLTEDVLYNVQKARAHTECYDTYTCGHSSHKMSLSRVFHSCINQQLHTYEVLHVSFILSTYMFWSLL